MKIPSVSTKSILCSLWGRALLLMVCFGLLPAVRAISPPPDGCYPAYTTAEGCNALQSLATGLGNTGVGWYALFGTSVGSYNTAVGAGALLSNAGDQNTATGVGSLLLNTSGTQNTANGGFALFNNTAGSGNIAIGYFAGSSVTGSNNIDIGNIGAAAESNTIRIGDPIVHAGIFLAGVTEMSPTAPNQAVLVSPATGQLGSADISSFGVVSTDPGNTAVGVQALASHSGERNTATGFQTMFSNTSGAFNDAVGAFALSNNSNGFSNNAVGDSALFSNITASENTALGDLALENNDSSGAGLANFNTAVGAQALFSNIEGDSNNAVGFNALGANTSGVFNEAMGVDALVSNNSGSGNVAIGDTALASNTSGTFNVAIGDSAASSVVTANNVICIGASVAGADVSNRCYIGQIFGVTSSGGTAVFINSSGQLGTVTSSRRFKDEIRPMEQASEAILALQPVTFRYKHEVDPAGVPQFGLVAEEVEKVNPNLVTRDQQGNPYTVRYEAVNAMLLNEFLKEHRTVQQQQKEIDALKAELKEQRAFIQAVNDKVELHKSVPQTVLNNQ